MSCAVLSARALNRATLDRQLLLRRCRMSVVDAVRHLCGMQAQAPFPPYFGLWSRLTGFKPQQLAQEIEGRNLVRIALMRGTVHLVTAEDALTLRPLIQPLMDRGLRSNTEFTPLLRGADLQSVAAAAREMLGERPRTSANLGKLLAERWPDHEPRALTHATRALLPLVQVPPRAIWGKSAQPTYATAEDWLGQALEPAPSPERMVLRYFAAYGPASVQDAQAWSGLTKLGEVVERLRPRLRTFRSEDGRELFDLPDAPRPDPDIPTPPRFLAPFDNLLLSHADRTRVLSDTDRKRVITQNGLVKGTILVGGVVRGFWRITRERDAATLSIETFTRLPKKDSTALASAGNRLLAFAEPTAATHDVRTVRSRT